MKDRFTAHLELLHGTWAVELSGPAGADMKRLPRSVANVHRAKEAAALLLVGWGMDGAVNWSEKPSGGWVADVRRRTGSTPLTLDALIERLTALRDLGIAGDMPVQTSREWDDIVHVRFDGDLEKQGCVVLDLA